MAAARLLKPLGNWFPNSVKFFAALEVLEPAKDRAWLFKLTNAVNRHWQKKKCRQEKRSSEWTGRPCP